MQKPLLMLLVLPLLVATAAGLTYTAFAADDDGHGHDEDGYVSVPTIPTDSGVAVQHLLYARTIHLEQPYTYYWRQERPQIDTCTVLVLEVDPEFARPQQTGVPVLYVGDTPAELTNSGYESGRLIVIVPGAPDLESTPIYYGSTELPEKVDATRGLAELAAAREMGLRAFSPAVIATARETGGEELFVGDANYLFLECATLIRTYSQVDQGQAEIYELFFDQ